MPLTTDLALLLLRVSVGGLLAGHGAQKSCSAPTAAPGWRAPPARCATWASSPPDPSPSRRARPSWARAS